jgi:predicted carbohydrate-binding protein with CBM5 and CBM33 domain
MIGTMTTSVALAVLAFASAVHGHGYLTIPSSRTRLGFEVSSPVSTLLVPEQSG